MYFISSDNSLFPNAEKFLINKSYQPVSLFYQEEHVSEWAAMVLSILPLSFLFLLFLSSIPCPTVSQTSNGGSSLPYGRLPSVAAAGPILQDRPFIVVWNMPTAHCPRRYGIHLNLEDFDIVENRRQHFQGQVIDLRESTVFWVFQLFLKYVWYSLKTQ